MKLRTFRLHHKWLGLFLSVFLVIFALSGIILNHRSLVAEMEVSRRFLPQEYQYAQWNNGLIRGTLAQPDSHNVVAYGSAGVWLTDKQGAQWQPYNDGLPANSDGRQVRQVVRGAGGELFACTAFGLYRYQDTCWAAVSLPLAMPDERLTDLTHKGDTLVAVSRSHLYWGTAPYTHFHRTTLRPSKEHDERVSLFRTLWLLHSGELFGSIGQLIVDLLGVLLIILVLTGVLHWFFPRAIKHMCHSVSQRQSASKQMLRNLWLHDRLGRYTLIAIGVVVFTGWCLRPPLLIAIAEGKVPVIPFSTLDAPDNAWHDRLRTLHYDKQSQIWLLHTSSGFYGFTHFEDMPAPIATTPPISVMGINTMEQQANGTWLIGSFAGIYLWDREQGTILDYITHQPPQEVTGPPIGQHMCAGYSQDFGKPIVFLYDKGTPDLPMPASMRTLPMSLWQIALEAHTGRIYTFLGVGRQAVVFVIGLATLWCLWAGYRIRRQLRKTSTLSKK